MGNLWKFSKDPISRRDHHHWFWGIQISYLRYVNYLQPGLHRDKYGIEQWNIFRSGAWLLTRFKAVWYGYTYHYPPTAIFLLKVITVTSEKPCYDYLRRCCVDFKQPNTCWESATFFIDLIKQALIVHRILYSFCEICNITKRKSIRKTCIEFYLSLRRSI